MRWGILFGLLTWIVFLALASLATAQPRYIIDAATQTGSLDLYIDGNIVTTYSYGDNNVTLSARLTDSVLSREALRQNISQIDEWIGQLNRVIQPAPRVRKTFNDRVWKPANGNIKGLCEHGPHTLADVTYNKNTHLITFAPRQALTLNWTDFVCFRAFLNRFLVEAERL